MTEQEFWNIVDTNVANQEVTGGEIDTSSIETHLVTLPIEEILSFQAWVEKAHERAHNDRINGAAYLMGGGCSDDGFYDFVGWLISIGSRAYYSVLRDADSLVEFGYGEDLDFLRHSFDAAEKKGELLDLDGVDLDQYVMAEPELVDPGPVPDVDDYENDDIMSEAYPKIWQSIQS